MKDKHGRKRGGPKAHLAKVKEGSKELYVAVVEEHVKKITKKSAIKEIERLLEIRKNAAEDLGKIIQDTGISDASIHRVMFVGEED